jgi:protocatechuate 3,4-dioxygenase beta subunit
MNKNPAAQAAHPDSDNDDAIIGKIYSRRHALQLLGLSGAALGLAACATPGTAEAASSTVGNLSCVVRPSATEGPFWIDNKLVRSDVRPDTRSGKVSAGVPLALTIQVAQYAASGCTNLGGALVDIWQCDALGNYSGENGDSGDFLRGEQRTGADGKVRFTTVYPGWYNGRTVHIHFRIRTLDAAGKVKSNFTSQLFFPDATTDTAFTAAPYNTRGSRTTRNANDSIFGNTGDSMLLDLSGDAGKGYAGTFVVGLKV